MTQTKTNFLEVVDGFLEDYSLSDLFEELFPGQNPSEVVYEMYEAGLIPEDMLEKFLND